MDGKTSVAVAGIVVAGVVGPSVAAWWGVAHQRRQQEHERQLGDLVELRKVLDDVARVADEAANFARDASSTGAVVAQYGEATAPQIKTAHRAATQSYFAKVSEAMGSYGRLAVRLGGEHAVTQAYGMVVTDLMTIGQFLADDDLKKFDGDWGSKLFRSFPVSLIQFLAEANKVAGSRLPTDPSRSASL
jgi:hypothetical protein